MTNVEQVASLARETQGDPERLAEVMRRLDGSRRFILGAAYAYARRRAQDTGWARAADVLELAILRQGRRPAGGPRPWHRLELITVVVVALIGGMAALQWRVAGRPSATPVLWLAFMFVHLWSVRRVPEMEVERTDAPGAGRVAQSTRDVLTQSARLSDRDPLDDDVVSALRSAAGHSDDEVSKALAAVALSRAERVVAGLPVRRRRRRLTLLRRARVAQLDAVAPWLLTP